MVPPQLARKMSVLSVDPPAPWAPGQIAAGRAHRPGSRRLGGVEAPGASPATGASWPDRRKGWASPGRGPVLPISRMGCVDSGSGALSSSRWSTSSWGRGLAPPGGARHWPSGLQERALRCGVALFLLVDTALYTAMRGRSRLTCPRSRRISPAMPTPPPERVPIGAGFDH